MNVLKESYKYVKRYTAAWVAIFFMAVANIIIACLIPQIPALIIDRIINPALGNDVNITNNMFNFVISGYEQTDYMGMLKAVLILFGILLILRYLIHYVRWNIAHIFGVRVEKKMRQKVFAKMLDQNSLIMSKYTSGDLMSICNSDPVQVKDLWSHNMVLLFDQFFAIAVSVYFLTRISGQLLIIPFSLGIVTMVVMVFYTKALRRCYNEIRTASVDLNSCVQENINGVRIIRSYASENIELDKFTNKSARYRNSFFSQAKVLAKYNVLINVLNTGITFGSMILGVILAAKGSMTVGQFTTFISYVALISHPLIQITNFMGVIQNSLICGNRMFTFINTANIICDPKDPLEILGKPNLSMRNVSIKLSDLEELRDITVDIPYGKRVGIMGKTGSGKSVMIKAFTRFFETTYGETMINGVNIKKYRVEDVRQQFGYVMQEVFLFSNTVDANIALYNPDAKHSEVEKAAKIAEAHDFILKLSDGYETIVGEKGLGLSGGQKQRVSIARALLKDAPVILLDDCTSALDMETERRILKNLDENYGGKTIIIASHRAASVVNCDEILYLEDGKIVERGSHNALMELNGRYADVFRQQEASIQEALN